MARISGGPKTPPIRPSETRKPKEITSNGSGHGTKVKIIRIEESAWYDTESCAQVIMRALNRNGIRDNNGLLFRGVPSDRMSLFLEHGSDYFPYDTVMATTHLCQESDLREGALSYAFAHDKSIVAVYKMLEPETDYIYRLDENHPNKGLLALVLL